MTICNLCEYQDECTRAGEYVFCPIDLELIIAEAKQKQMEGN